MTLCDAIFVLFYLLLITVILQKINILRLKKEKNILEGKLNFKLQTISALQAEINRLAGRDVSQDYFLPSADKFRVWGNK